MTLKYDEMEMIVMDMLSGSKVRVTGPDADIFISQFQADIDLAKKNGWNIEIPHDIEDISIDPTKKRKVVTKGGPGSGHFGHAGRPGKVGGSASSGKKVQLPLFEKPDPDESNISPYSEGIETALATARALEESGNAANRRGFHPEAASAYWDYLERENKLHTQHEDDEGISKESYVNVLANVTGLEGDREEMDVANLIYDAFEYGDDETGLRAEVTIITLGWHGEEFIVQGHIIDPRGYGEEEVGYFRRKFQLGDDGLTYVTHDMFRLDEHWQNQGFGSRFYENCEAAYMNAGLDGIFLEANMSVGGYAWARMGFDFRNEFTLDMHRDNFLRDLLRIYPADSYGESPIDIDYLSSNIEHSWDIAAYEGPDGRRVGKEYLLGSSWEAEKMLVMGTEGVDIGDAYYDIKKRKK